MKTWVRRSLNAGALAAGALLVAGAPAQADTAVSADNNGILNGTQILTPIQIPIDVCGNAVAVAGVAVAGCDGGSAAALHPEWTYARYQQNATLVSSGNNGILNGTQVYAPVQAPVNVCGNAVAVAGAATAACEGGARASHGTGKHRKGYGHKESLESTGGKPYRPAPPHAPPQGNKPSKPSKPHKPGHGTGILLVSKDNSGVLNGTQVYAPVQAPINLCGNAIGVAGSAIAGCEGGATALLG